MGRLALRKVNEPRVLVNELIAVGCRVVRGTVNSKIIAYNHYCNRWRMNKNDSLVLAISGKQIYLSDINSRRAKDFPKGQSNSIEKKLITPWQIKKKTNRQIIVHKTQHRKLKTEQHESYQKLGVISGAPEVYANPAPHVAPVVLFMLLQTR